MSPSAHRRRIFSIPSGAPFLPAFVEALLAGRVIEGFPARDDPMALAQARIFVPTRRAARALTAELARQIAAPAVLLPQIVPLGAMDDSETQALFDQDTPMLGRPDVVSHVERRIVLAELILAWSRAVRNAILHVENGRLLTSSDEPLLVAAAPAQAFHLAGELGALIDEMVIEGADPGALARLTPEAYDRYWGITLDFLKIAFEKWPEHLMQRGLEDRAQRQAALVDREIEWLNSGRISGPQIVIGSTGTNVATARLIAAIAALPQGAAVLPGFDKTLDAESRVAIDGAPRDGKPALLAAGHPQAAMRRLLRTMGVADDEVEEIGAAPAAVASRIKFFHESQRPAETTGKWFAWRRAQPPQFLADALCDVVHVEAEDERQEALAIAIALRRILETPGETAAFITPDRGLARRVRSELQRWSVEVDDSGGDPLSGEPSGILASLALACADPRADAAALLALLDHAHVRLGFAPADYGRLRTHAEIAVLRGAACDLSHLAGAVGLARARAEETHAHPAVKAVRAQGWDELEVFFAQIEAALRPLREISGARAPKIWFEALARVLEALTSRAESDDSAPFGEDAQALQRIIDSFTSLETSRFDLSFDDFASLFALLAHEEIVRGPRHAHPRVKILGLLEARLLSADHAILGGLDESVWPPAATTDAFLNRGMRADLGLSSPERRIGQTAHDFITAAGAPHLILTRARKRDGAPTVASRFLQRIEALAGEAWQACAKAGDELLTMARQIDEPGKPPQPMKRPEPRPPLALRPKSLSITEIETWRRDPYSIYAKHILELIPLDDVEADNAHAEFGTRLHDALADFHKLYPSGALPAEAGDRLLEIAEKQFRALLADPGFRAFKWPDVVLSLQTFVEWENERRELLQRIVTEESGRLRIPLDDGDVFTLRGRADRIEIGKDGAVTVIDFKTGKIPTQAEIAAGFSPQLTLEAAMIECGAFSGVGAGAKVREALYVPIGKGEDDRPRAVGTKDKPFEQLVAEHYEGLRALAEQFRDEATPYLARPMPQYKSRFGVYDHLSRVKEWSSETDGDGE